MRESNEVQPSSDAGPAKPTSQVTDPDEIIALRRRLAIHRRNLYTLEEQKAKYGLDVPLRIINEIAEQEEAIAQIEVRLGELGQDTPTSQATPQASQPDKAGTSPSGAGYHIHIERATGLAIGDGAQVIQTGAERRIPAATDTEDASRVTNRDQRCADLSEHIRETLDLIKQYEDQRRLTDDPKARRRAEREIAELRSQLAAYEAEYRELGCE